MEDELMIIEKKTSRRDWVRQGNSKQYRVAGSSPHEGSGIQDLLKRDLHVGDVYINGGYTFKLEKIKDVNYYWYMTEDMNYFKKSWEEIFNDRPRFIRATK